MNRISVSLTSLLALAFLACGGSSAKVASKTGPGLGTDKVADKDDQPLDVDSRILTGVLPNGLTYYILAHQKPEQRAQLWLGVNAGSVLEDDDQQGLAHFVEHMAFNGTEKFEKMAIVNYMESIGMKFGADVNAYTSFDQTVYMLQVPTDEMGVVTKGLDILHQWAGSISFDPTEVDKERGVVTEEWRLGRGASSRIADKQYPLLFAGSKYGQRLPIGKPEILKNAPTETLVRYYKDWYRPDLMAIVAVGDFDASQMEAQIKEKFSDLKNPAEARIRPIVPIPSEGKAAVSIETDPEMQYTSVSIQTRMKTRAKSSANDYRRLISEELYHDMFNARLAEIIRQADSPFLYAGSSTGSLARSADTFTRFAVVKQDFVERSLRVLAEEERRVQLYGFTESEFERAKKKTLRAYKSSVLERSKTDGKGYAAEILRHFFAQEMMPGIETELSLVERYLPTITLAELNTLTSGWGNDDNRVVLIAGPEGLKAPAEEDVLAVLDSVVDSDIVAYTDEVSSKPLLAKAPTAGSITTTKSISEIGVTEWTLSNGAKVVVKPTDFKNDEIQFGAFSPGGHSLVRDEDFTSANFAGSILRSGGIGEHSAVQLSKMLAGKKVYVGGNVSELEEGLYGSASPQDLQTFFELIYLQFTAPRADENAFAAWKAQQGEQIRNRRNSPEGSFFDDMNAFRSQNHLRRRAMTMETLESVKLDKALSIYKERFADASDFTFVFVGNIDLVTFKPLVEKYIASLPAIGRKEKWKDIGVKMPKGRKLKTTRKGVEPKSFFYLTFHGKEKWTPEHRNNMAVLSEVLTMRLREVLREDMGGVYGASSRGGIQRRPRDTYQFTVFFGCAPERVEELKKAVFATIAEIQKKGIEDSYLKKVLTVRTRQRELDLKGNRFWSRELSNAYRYKKNPIEILDDSLLAKVSSKQVKAAAKKYLGKQYVLGVMEPEKP